MISDIAQGLIQLHGDFSECAALEKMQAQSITLVVRQSVEESLDGRSSDQLTEELVGFRSV
jgi:hypothetical protein